jgi:hypothetical protein
MCLPTPEFRGFARGRQGGTLRPKWESVPLQNAVGQSADTCSSRRRDDLDLDPLGRTAELGPLSVSSSIPGRSRSSESRIGKTLSCFLEHNRTLSCSRNYPMATDRWPSLKQRPQGRPHLRHRR